MTGETMAVLVRAAEETGKATVAGIFLSIVAHGWTQEEQETLRLIEELSR